MIDKEELRDLRLSGPFWARRLPAVVGITVAAWGMLCMVLYVML